MVISAKHKVTLWVPTILYVYLMLGEFGTDKLGGLVYRISTRGAVSSVLILSAAVLISHGSRGAFIAGIVCWVLALAALLLEKSPLLVLHF
jgi:hypothetical protein